MATESRVLGHFELPSHIKANYKEQCKHCSAMISESTKTCSNVTTHLRVSYVERILA